MLYVDCDTSLIEYLEFLLGARGLLIPAGHNLYPPIRARYPEYLYPCPRYLSAKHYLEPLYHIITKKAMIMTA
jgi:hypothetical protein